MIYKLQFVLFILIIKVFCETEKGDDPLILTPYLKANKIEEARNLSRVDFKDFREVINYSGFFTVNEEFHSNSFFWFFPSEDNYKKDPVVLWLQGGPGLPSMYGLLEENGPFSVKNNTISLRDFSWTKNHSMLYIDNPVGTGFSFTNGGYATNESQIGEELYTALIQFFTLFPELQKNHFFVSGESYAGKYIPSVCYTIHQKNPTSKLPINLKGLLINNGYVDPINQMDFGDYVYQLGLVDSGIKDQLDSIRDEAVQHFKDGNLPLASFKSSFMIDLIMKQSGLVSVYNYQADENKYYNFKGDWVAYLQKKGVKLAIHVGNITFKPHNEIVYEHLSTDDCISVVPMLSELLEHYPTLIFNGQLDVIVPYTLTVNYLKKLNYSAAAEYKTAKRSIWKVGEDVAGYCKTAGFLTECMVRNAGHVVPMDQPKYAFDLVYRFIRNISLSDNSEANVFY